ncbi:Exc2 family lipoprotein [Klebsiella indica]|uniref:Exc2 family lipoprotein n=1 Tax=Klebsiella indica TaxID=2582917 RepID=A0A5R9LN89_9ENTR|nr:MULTISPECIES: Exc2 family lipoprotein [Klebsiella]TLV22684.1 Exc2 family lipoprotein [Klebsiella indica]
MKLNIAIIALSCALAALVGCSSSKSSPERHAYYFVSHRSDFVGGNFATNRQENYRLNLPNFTGIYARGQQDRKSGVSESDARRIADGIKQQMAQGTRIQHTFNGNASDKWENEMENKDAVLLGNELAGAYLDGYLGVK